MGIIDIPSIPSTAAGRLGLALKLESVPFMTFWFLAYTMKFGMIWQDSAGPPMGPPFFASPDMVRHCCTTACRCSFCQARVTD